MMQHVDYLVARAGMPPRRGTAYDYVLAGDGLYIVADNDWLDVRIPVARCPIRGLSPLAPAVILKYGRIQQALWEDIVTIAQDWATSEHEVLVTVGHDPSYGYHLVVPNQVVSSERVMYQPPASVVLELHSHHRLPARFSLLDDADEQRLGLYGIVGRLRSEHPEVALRVGAYGYFLPVPWETVFEGDPGPFHSVPFGEGNTTEAEDGLSF